MNDKKIKLNGTIFAGVIIIVNFFYAINIQPVVIGESNYFKTNDEFKIQGAFVYKLTLENGFEYRSIITHIFKEEIQKYDYVLGSSLVSWCPRSHFLYVTGSFQIGNILYTIYDDMIKMNCLDDLKEINCLKLK